MKTWIKRLLEQFEWDTSAAEVEQTAAEMSEEKATLLYIIDTYNKQLFEVDKHPIRKVRGQLDQFAKALMQANVMEPDRTLFNFRQWFSSYRIDEVTYIENTFDDFKKLIWEFADQLSEELKEEQKTDQVIDQHLDGLREAVESNSIETLRAKSREFINTYIEQQGKKNQQRTKRMARAKENLTAVKKQLVEAHHTIQRDHLTGLFNRRSFDEKIQSLIRLQAHEPTACTLIIADIDHFKKVNDTYGHDIGDFVIQECARILGETFNQPGDMVARVGGEEFAILLPNCDLEKAILHAELALQAARKAVFVHGSEEIRFTISIGIAPLLDKDRPEEWYKRADTALYQSKTGGRNRYSIASGLSKAA